MAKVVVVGSCNCDLIVRLDHLPREGETVSGGEFFQCFGGKGANQAVAAFQAGAQVTLIGKVGRDRFGESYRESLMGLGMEAQDLLQDESSPTGLAFILVDRTGKNQIAVASGANLRLSTEELSLLSDRFLEARVLLVQLEVPLPTVKYALELARDRGIQTILDPAPVPPGGLPSDLLSLVDILTPNEAEAEALTGCKVEGLEQIRQAGQRLRSQGIRSALITLGARGAYLQTATGEEFFPAFPVNAIDSTAAGDAFNGALAYALSEGRSLREAVIWANAAGALATSRLGAQPSLPTHQEIEALLALHPA
ncbi:MAG: ribokinase [Candidatus Tectomicrobia bacterium]|uniref:Ribokinase n=1 Tax=Tectimicrobiota bacterium TaxID=2528274 RepID=A0A932CM34_UNCTE|nr:ribokinase [Candidatus Tectomicrobia bacterium]